MKNQYFGDVNDYVKYGLLRCFAESNMRIGVCWMLTRDDGRSDGRKIKYLSHPEVWRHHDAPLFRILSKALSKPDGRHIRHIKRNNCIPHSRFFGDLVPDEKSERAMWARRALTALTGSDLVFFDPDNGIEVPSKPLGRKGSSKYVYWDELQDAWKAGSSLLIFQHFPRMKRDEYIAGIGKELRRRMKGSTVVPIRTSYVLFLLVHQLDQRAIVAGALKLIESRWSSRVCTHPAN